MLNPLSFRAYDIRGIAEDDLSSPNVYLIGRALGTLARRRGAEDFAVGRDCRLSGPRIAAEITRGLLDSGLDVIDVGMVPTPLLYFSVFTRNYGGGVQVTGSHNPAEYNGLKMMIGEDTLHGNLIQKLLHIAQAEDFESGEGMLRSDPITEDYLRWVTRNIHMGPRKLRVVVDGGNGVAGPPAMELYRRLGVEVIGKYIEPDGTFPNHHPDPTEAHAVEILQQHVREEGVDAAIGLDGDGDRIGVVDDQGQVQWGDRLMILFSRAVLAEEPGAAIVGEVKCSRTLYDDIRAHGGEAIMYRTGHSLIKAKMKQEGAALGGEMSGHIFFKHRFFGFDDALYAGARLLEILSHSDEPLSALLADVPETFATPELRVDCPDELKFDVVARVVEKLRDRYEVNDIDGARVDVPGGWGLVRASNTQPVLVVRTEADSPERRDEILEELQTLIAEASEGLGAVEG